MKLVTNLTLRLEQMNLEVWCGAVWSLVLSPRTGNKKIEGRSRRGEFYFL